MKRLFMAIVAGGAAAVSSWFTIMWMVIWLGHLIYPEDIHNLIAQSGALLIGPIGGITLTARRAGKELHSL